MWSKKHLTEVECECWNKRGSQQKWISSGPAKQSFHSRQRKRSIYSIRSAHKPWHPFSAPQFSDCTRNQFRLPLREWTTSSTRLSRVVCGRRCCFRGRKNHIQLLCTKNKNTYSHISVECVFCNARIISISFRSLRTLINSFSARILLLSCRCWSCSHFHHSLDFYRKCYYDIGLRAHCQPISDQ